MGSSDHGRAGEQVAENEAVSAKSVVDGTRQRFAKPQPADSRHILLGTHRLTAKIESVDDHSSAALHSPKESRPNRPTDRQTDGPTDRQTDGPTDRQTDYGRSSAR